ncbi:hypothetical protein F511_37407 [Dorcoceras hygrometricum]|uniref:Uncharacterized protein n=1 Tax=Dorcoceras hygrometricum TaxID=472368 RepID=A0A2Z7AZC8_9LAMI|nr:hypothetical protein F511_37407 [Dorcoceras hygrometricum]
MRNLFVPRWRQHDVVWRYQLKFAGVDQCDLLVARADSLTPLRRRLVVASWYSIEESDLRAFDTYCSSNPYCSSYSISFDCRRFAPPFRARLVTLGSSLQDISFGTTLEPWVDLSSEHDVVEAFDHFRNFRLIVLLFCLISWLVAPSSVLLKLSLSCLSMAEHVVATEWFEPFCRVHHELVAQ